MGKRLKGSGIYLNDHLTSKNSELAKSARDLKRDSNRKIISTWTWDCKVFVKDNMGKVKMINDDSDLSDFRYIITFSPLQNQNCNSNLVDMLATVIPESNPNSNQLNAKLEIDNYAFQLTSYCSINDLIQSLTGRPNSFNIFSLNCQCLNTKFDQLFVVANALAQSHVYFDTICL